MGKDRNDKKPEVYALRQEGGSWQISRREFLKAAGIGAAAAGIGLNSRFVRPASAAESLEQLCNEAPSHKSRITDLQISADGQYLLSVDEDARMKCWNMVTHSLLGTAEAPDDTGTFDGVVSIDGVSAAIRKISDHSLGAVMLPDLEEYSDRIEITAGNFTDLKSLAFTREGDIYAVTDKSLLRIVKGDGAPFYQDQSVIYSSAEAKGIAAFTGDRDLFILNENGFGILDPEAGSVQNIETSGVYEAFSALPEGNEVLVCEKDGTGYKLISMDGGSEIWSGKTEADITAAAISPLEDCAVLLGKDHIIRLVSMKTGAVINQFDAGDVPLARIAMSADGSQCAVAVNKSILFISLPDLKILGCPVDLTEVTKDNKGIEISGTDPVTGETVTYTLPCGAPIPEGAVCICNCVAGSACTCVGHKVCTCDTVCTCVGHKVCTCDTVCSCVGHTVTYHYWHPN